MMARRAAALVALTFVYVTTAVIGLRLGAGSGFASLTWAPAGISLAALLLWGSWLWPAVFAGAFIGNALEGAPIAASFGIALGNCAAATVSVRAIGALTDFKPALDRLRDVIALVTIGALVGPLISASAGVTSLWLCGVVPAQAFGTTWQTWWLGDFFSDLVLAPFLLTWAADFRLHRERSLDKVVVVLCIVAAAALVLSSRIRGIEYLLLPLALGAVLRLGQKAATTTSLVISVAGIPAIFLGYGPFVDDLRGFELFTASLALTSLILGGVLGEMRRARDQAVGAVRDRDAFISIAAHELRTPLSVLQLQADMLMQPDLIKTKFSEAAPEKVRDQVRRLTKLVENLLDHSRISAGKLHLELADVDLSRVVGEVVQRCADQLRQAGCEVSLFDNGPVMGRWDAMRLEQIVINLLSNAWKYGAGKPIRIGIDSDGDAAILTVRDQGCGIDADEQERIFEPFERSERALTQATRGLGLGLWIVRQIVHALGGSISVRSERASGSLFTVTLPRRAASLVGHQDRAASGVGYRLGNAP